jgi:serine/threonine-protein kinase
MAVVFRARDERLGRLVALKILGPGLAADEDFRRRFIREWRAAAAVDDPHIIPVHQAGEAAGVLFIAMRYVPGGDVRTLLRRSGPLSPARAAAIISPVASALDAAHAAGLVHRDVKPANMLVDVRPGRPDHVYLSDFGLSKGTLSAGLTGSGQFLGTPGYSAPEQIRGRPVDGRADQYALACTAFELLGGAAVFPRDEILAVMYAHLSEPPPRLTARRPGTPAAADAVFARALAKEPAGRYSSCREFADALCGAFGLPAYHVAHKTSRPPDEITEGSAPAAAGNGAGPGALPQSADLRSSQLPAGRRDEAESWPVTQHRARHARAPTRAADPPALPAMPPVQAEDPKPPAYREQEAARKPGVTRRAVLGLAAATTAGLAVTGWELSHANPRHNNPRHASTSRPAGGTPIWTTTIPSDGDFTVGPVANQGGVLYIGYTSGPQSELYALRAINGHTLWRRPGSTLMTISRQVVYTVFHTGHGLEAVAYDASTGTVKWKSAPLPLTLVTGLAMAGGPLFLVGAQGDLYALNPGNGGVLWTFPRGSDNGSGLAASGETAYVSGADNGIFYAVRSGRKVWDFSVRGATTLDPIVVVGGVIFTSSSSRGVYALRAEDGHELWNFRSGTEGFSVAGSIVFTGNRNGMIHALRAADGVEIWRSSAGNIDGLVTGRNAVYIRNQIGEVRALRSENGREIWRVATRGLVSWVTEAQGTVYVCSNNLYAVRAADGRRLWSFPVESTGPAGLITAPGVVYVGSGSSMYALRA